MGKLLPSLLVPLVLAFPLILQAETAQADDAQPAILNMGGKILAEVNRELKLPFVAHVESVLVAVGDRVSAGQEILRYTMYPQDRKQYERDLAAQQQTILDLETKISVLNEQAKTLGNELSLQKQLFSQGIASQASLTAAANRNADIQNSRVLARNRLETARRLYELSLQIDARYFGCKPSGNRLPATLILRSPIDGTITDLNFNAKPGSVINTNAVIAHVAALGHLQAHCIVGERYLNEIKKGNSAVIRLPQHDNKELSGTVGYISWKTLNTKVDWPGFYDVLIDIDANNLDLKIGERVRVEVSLQKHSYKRGVIIIENEDSGTE